MFCIGMFFFMFFVFGDMSGYFFLRVFMVDDIKLVLNLFNRF